MSRPFTFPPPTPRDEFVVLLAALVDLARSIDRRLGAIEGAVTDLKKMEAHMAGELDALTAQVTANTSAEASAITLLQNLHDLLVGAGTDPAKLAALADTLKTSGDALAAAIVANTPSATP